ncbi:MAG: CHAT domain-containing protein [Gammaproteobacteria bacterium]|nr:CHAT domain-containing protein [Gammaproteobacteria bacterium]
MRAAWWPSLWQVEDVSTARLMRGLYGSLTSTESDAALALQRAQLSLRAFADGSRQPYDHPYYWAGFVVSGSPQ